MSELYRCQWDIPVEIFARTIYTRALISPAGSAQFSPATRTRFFFVPVVARPTGGDAHPHTAQTKRASPLLAQALKRQCGSFTPGCSMLTRRGDIDEAFKKAPRCKSGRTTARKKSAPCLSVLVRACVRACVHGANLGERRVVSLGDKLVELVVLGVFHFRGAPHPNRLHRVHRLLQARNEKRGRNDRIKHHPPGAMVGVRRYMGRSAVPAV